MGSETMDLSGLSKDERTCLEALEAEFPPEVVPQEDVNFKMDTKTYLRYVRATGAKVEESKRRLRETLAWRAAFRPYLITETMVAPFFEALTMRVGGRCREGRPILVMTLSVPNEFEVQDRVNVMVYILEVTEKKGYEQITWLIDFGEMGKHKRNDKAKEARKLTMGILQDHYPERLGLMLLYRTPWYINLLFPFVKPFLDKRTRDRMYKVGNKVEDLLKYIDMDQIPDFLGGTFASTSVESLEKLPDLSMKSAGFQSDVPGRVGAAAEQSSIFDEKTDVVPPAGEEAPLEDYNL